MLRRKETKNETKSRKQSERAHRRKDRRKGGEDARKGRGRRARETIREAAPQRERPRRTQPRDPGPPLRIRTPEKKQIVGGMTPEDVVRNWKESKGGRKR